MTCEVHTALHSYHIIENEGEERISICFGYRAPTDGDDILLFSSLPHLFADDCYVTRGYAEVGLDRDVFAAVVAQFMRSDADVFLYVHDHHFSSGGTRFSITDDNNDRMLGRYFASTVSSLLAQGHEDHGPRRAIHFVSMVLDRTGADIRVVDLSAKPGFSPVASLSVVDTVRRQIIPYSQVAVQTPMPDHHRSTHDRQMAIIRADIQRALSGLKAVIVGAGGTGSIVGEALVRLGFGDLTLIDGDIIEETNLNRWQGGVPEDIGLNKAVCLTRNLRRMEPSATIVAVADTVFSDTALEALKSADIIVGCVDDDVARHVMNRAAIQYLIPYFDVGVSVVAEGGIDFLQRVFAIVPGSTACMCCSQIELYDPKTVSNALVDGITAQEKLNAGYVAGQSNAAAPSVYALNLMASGRLTTEIINWICGYRPFATTVFIRWKDGVEERTDRANFPEGPTCDCYLCNHLLGTGDSERIPVPPSDASTANLARKMVEWRDKLMSNQHAMTEDEDGEAGAHSGA